MTDQPLQNASVPSVGQLLKEARETRQIALEAVAKTLCISKSQLANLENDHEGLMCDVYTLGFLRSYAQFLGLNASALIQKFKDQTISPPSSRLVFPVPLPERGMPSFRILCLSLLAILSIAVGYEWLKTRRVVPLQQEEPVLVETPLQETIKVVESPLSQEPITPIVQEAPQALVNPPLSSPQAVLLKAIEDTWVEVKDEKRNIIVSRMFHPGDTYEFKDFQNLVLKTGNARGVQLSAGERTLTFPGSSGEIKSEISLNPEKWATSSTGGE